MKAAVVLKQIDENNFIDAFHLKLNAEQEKFVSHPIRSLAQAYVYRNQSTPFGIYAGDTMVGYVMVLFDPDVPEYDIWHLMIDEQYQHRGYGKAAMLECIRYIETAPFGSCGRIALTCSKDNTAALAMYENLGFVPTGVCDEDEIELVLMRTTM